MVVCAETHPNIFIDLLLGFLPVGNNARKLPNAEVVCYFLDVNSQTVFIAP
jgi:hypothetical protein